MNTHTIDVARDFSRYPFGCSRAEGEYSGEAFRDDMLLPAMRKYDHVRVDLSGSGLYGSPFLEEVFSGLVPKYFTKEQVDEKLEIIHTKLPSIVLEIQEYIEDAAGQKEKVG